MRSRFGLLAVIMAFSSQAELAAQCIPSKSSPYDLRTQPTRRPPGPGIEQLQSLAREYYPGLARQDAPAGIAIGLVLDSTCKVLRHSASFTPDSADSDGVLRAIFPDLKALGTAGGIADAVPPTRRARPVLIAWTILADASEKRP